MGIKADVTTPREATQPLEEPEQASGEELRAKAKELDIQGRSKMSNDELAEAIAEAESGPSAHR